MTRARAATGAIVVILLVALAVIAIDRATMQRIDGMRTVADCPGPGIPEPHILCVPWQPGDSQAPSVAP